jgi:hypothetical protein
VYALVLDTAGGSHHLAVIDAPTGRVGAHQALPSGVVYRSIATGPITGRIYLFGNRTGKRALGVIVTVLDPRDLTTVANRTIRHTGTLDWRIYRGLVSRDERRLYIDYWRGYATGIDAVVLPSGILRDCLAARRLVGCISPGFYNVELFGDGLIVASPYSSDEFLELDANGAIRRRVKTHLGGLVHPGEWVVDPVRQELYQLGSCGYTGGLGAVALASGRSRVMVDPPSYRICGERLAVGPQSLLVIGKDSRVIPQPGLEGGLLFVDGRTGKLLRTVRTPSEPADVIVAPGR